MKRTDSASVVLIDSAADSKPINKAVANDLKILCFNLKATSNTFMICCVGIFTTYLAYGYLQELIFTRLEGISGWYLTLCQFLYYTVFGYVEKLVSKSKARAIPIKVYMILATLTLGTMGFSNASLAYLNYPTQVIFKSAKLIPVLLGAIIIQKKKVGPLDFFAAICMCIGLIFFTLADSKISPTFSSFGVFMISIALLCDAIIGNVQEKYMKAYNASNHEVVFYSYGIGFAYLLVMMVVSGDLVEGVKFGMHQPLQVYGYAFLFSISGYVGIQFVLVLVRTVGAPIAVTVTTARKAITIALSFIIFFKPFTWQYLWSGLIVVFGIYLNVYNKKNPMTMEELKSKGRSILQKLTKRYDQDRKLLLDV